MPWENTPKALEPSEHPVMDSNVPIVTVSHGRGFGVVFVKDDAEKPKLELIPVNCLSSVAEVLSMGAKKYGKDNWRSCTDLDRYYGALLRHLFAYKSGELVDKESGLPHLSHAMCNVMFLLELTTKP